MSAPGITADTPPMNEKVPEFAASSDQAEKALDSSPATDKVNQPFVAPALASFPTMADMRKDPALRNERRVRSRTLSQAKDTARLGRTLSRVVSPPYVGPTGACSPGDEDESGMRPPRSEDEAEADEVTMVADIERGGKDWEVHFDGPDDKLNPKSWNANYRWALTGASGLLVLNATFSSSAPSGVIPDMIVYFGFGREVATLLISLFVAGYVIGPLAWGPMSEVYGRRPIFLISFFVYSCFNIGCALSKNTASILIFRLLAGIFAACPLTNAGGVISDIWDAERRGIAMAAFSLAPFAGPALGPIVGGYMANAGQPWQNLFWVLLAFSGACFVLILFGIPETYTPKILSTKAARKRKETGEQEWYAPLDRQATGFKARLNNTLVKPFRMLVLEPMLLAVTLYMSFIYGVIYLLFEAYPIVFGQGHGFSEGASGLMFLPLFLGGAAGCISYILYFNPRYVKAHRKYSQMDPPQPTPPELRLEMALLGSWMLVISFFWFGWTSFPSISYWSPMLAGGLLGWSFIYVFLALFNYIIDTYLFAAASALSANTVCRSAFGAGFPLFATQMFETLNPRWASTLLGFLALIMAPIPLIFIKFGPKLRSMSRFAANKPK